MPKKFNKYQYETSPRKLEPEYTPVKEKKPPKKSTAKNPDQKSTKKKRISKEKQLKKQKKETIAYIIIGFAILFAISYRNSQIDEKFAEVQDLKQKLSEIEKQNTQLKVSIESSLNLNNLEQQAKELLGMQKLSNTQTVYVSLPKTDYIEVASEEVIIEENSSGLKSIIKSILNTFK